MGLQMPHVLGEKMSDSTPTTLNDMIELLTEAQEDYSKFYGDGNKAAGTRVRKVMQQIKAAAHDVSVHVQATKNA